MYPGILTAPGNAKLSETKKTYTNRRWPLGTLLVTQDGRAFRFAENGATALAAGVVVQSEVPGANFDELAVPTARSVGDREVTVTNGATSVTADMFAGGYLNVEDDTGEGTLYLIESNSAAGNAGTISITLAEGLTIAWTTSTTVGLTKHPLADVIIHPSPPTAAVQGVVPTSVAANAFFWAQVRGPASVLTDGTVGIGKSVMASDATDGSVEAWALTEGTPNTEIAAAIGTVMEVGATTEHSLVKLAIE